MGVLIKVLANAAALWVAVLVLDGLQMREDAWGGLLIVALLLGVANVLVKPVLKLLSLPLVILTLGLFLLVVNAIVLWIVLEISASLDLGITSEGFGWTFLAAVIVSIVSWGIEALFGAD